MSRLLLASILFRVSEDEAHDPSGGVQPGLVGTRQMLPMGLARIK